MREFVHVLRGKLSLQAKPPSRLSTAIGIIALLCLITLVLFSFAPAPAEVSSGDPRVSATFHLIPRALVSGPKSCVDAARAANPIAAENTCPGTDAWRADRAEGTADAIEGFTAPSSVDVGGSIQVYVSTMARTFAFQVYRLGWYQEHGGRLMYTSPPLVGMKQPAPLFDSTTRTVSAANWQRSATLDIPASWVSGIYVVKLYSIEGFIRYTLFVVRNDASRAPMLFQTSLMTYQAYNWWGSFGLYSGLDPRGKYSAKYRSYVASFDRPIAGYGGLGVFVLWDYNWIRWLERQSYDLTYTSDIDVARQGALLLNHRLLVVASHDEYWTTAMRANVTAARDAGVSLAFLGANDIYWHARLQQSPLGPDRLLVCYRTQNLDPLGNTQPRESTTRWRDAPVAQPENALLGGMYGGIATGIFPLVLSAGSQPFLAGTGLAAGQSLPGLVGGEIDRIFSTPAAPYPPTALTASPVACASCQSGGPATTDTTVANATLYTAPSGAKVFDAGTFQWSWGLDDDRAWPGLAARTYANQGFQRYTANILAYLLAAPVRAAALVASPTPPAATGTPSPTPTATPPPTPVGEREAAVLQNFPFYPTRGENVSGSCFTEGSFTPVQRPAPALPSPQAF